MSQWNNSWCLFAFSSELHGKLAREVAGHSLLLFRDDAEQPVVMEDRCPHRNVALSLGRVEGGSIRCPYHGWRFDKTGACVEAPCLGPDEPLPSRRVKTYPCVEREGAIWVAIGDVRQAQPPAWPSWGDDRYAKFEVVSEIRCGIEQVLANFVDSAHTGFVHPGLFRGRPTRAVRAVIEETTTGVRIETSGESDPKSLLSRLLLPRGMSIQHIDEFIAPSTIRVDYHLGSRHVLTVSRSMPAAEGVTRVFTRVLLRAPPMSKVLMPALRLSTLKILEQDKHVLESQDKTMRRFGGAQFESIDADVPTSWVLRSFLQFSKGITPRQPLRKQEVTYML